MKHCGYIDGGARVKPHVIQAYKCLKDKQRIGSTEHLDEIIALIKLYYKQTFKIDIDQELESHNEKIYKLTIYQTPEQWTRLSALTAEHTRDPWLYLHHEHDKIHEYKKIEKSRIWDAKISRQPYDEKCPTFPEVMHDVLPAHISDGMRRFLEIKMYNRWRALLNNTETIPKFTAINHVRGWLPWALDSLRSEINELAHTMYMTPEAIAIGKNAPVYDSDV